LYYSQNLFSSITEVLKYIQNEDNEDSKTRQAYSLLKYPQTFLIMFSISIWCYLFWDQLKICWFLYTRKIKIFWMSRYWC